MHIGITGGSGLVGQAVAEHFKNEGHIVHIFTRKKDPSSPYSQIEWLQGETPTDLPPIDYYVHLAGASINEGRWTEKHKQAIYNSRMDATNALIDMIRANDYQPKAIFQASATGIYPFSETAVYDETSAIENEHFLAQTVRDWERLTSTLQRVDGIRTVFMRFGIVLSSKGGALPMMSLPYKLFGGGRVGSGRQWVSWVHIQDIVQSIAFFIENEQISGPVNLTAPNPVRMDEFGHTIGKVLHRPHWFPVPAFLLHIVLGEKAEIALKGQCVVPKVLEDNGYKFLYPQLQDALKDLL